MAARPAHAAAQPADLLLRHLDRIKAAATDSLRCAAELADRVLHALEQLGMFVREEAGAEVAAVLLVAEDGENDVATWLDLGARGAQERVDHHRDAALHVERAAAPEPAVHQLASERRMRPLLARGRDDVDVPVQEERRRLARAAHARDEIRPRVVLRDDARLDAGFLEQAPHVCDARALVPGRIRRVEADEIAEKVDDVHYIASSARTRRSTSAAVL